MTAVAPALLDKVGDALLAATLLAIAPEHLGGAVLEGAGYDAQSAWLAVYGSMRPADEAALFVPASVTPAQIDGDIDLAATLAAGRRIVQPGLVARADGRPLVLVGAERWSRAQAAVLSAALEAAASRGRHCALLAIDGRMTADEAMAPALADRLAFRLDLDGVRARDIRLQSSHRLQVVAAQDRLRAGIEIPVAILQALVAAAAALGIGSSRADRFAAAAARAHAAWRGASVVDEQDAEAAVRLTLVHRARQMPEMSEGQSQEAPEDEPSDASNHHPDEPAGSDRDDTAAADEDAGAGALEDRLVEIAAAALPRSVLDGLASSRQPSGRAPDTGGRSCGPKRRSRRGRPLGHAPGDPRRDGPLHLIGTIERAAPWQAIRRRSRQSAHSDDAATRRLVILPSDIRVVRFKQDIASLKIFAVDASGSSALHRMGEAKGAVELLLAECYARREQVALIAFRGSRPEVLLPPTRALARARRELAALPGGGATPLAGGIDAARELAITARRAGQSPLVVLMTDGRANIDRDGKANRSRANEHALDAARRLAAEGIAALMVDTSVSGKKGTELARAMHARYVALPNAGARDIADAVSQRVP